MGLKDDWKSAKTFWEKNGEKVLEGDVLKDMVSGGWDSGKLGSKLGAFDAAKDQPAKLAVSGGILKQLELYQKLIKKASSSTKEGKAKSGLNTLDDELEEISDTVRDDSQPPKPSGRSEKILLVAAQNVAGGRRPVWLKGGTLDVKSYLVVDEHVAELEKANKLGYHWTEIQKECAELVKSYGDRFIETIEKVEVSLAALGSNKSEYDKKVAEANGVLKYYTGLVEAEVNKAVDAYWARALARRGYLKTFKKEVKTDIAMSSVAIVASSVSIAMSFGTAALSALVIAKAVMDIALALEKAARSADAVKGIVEGKMQEVEAVYKERLLAVKEERGQKAAKAGQVSKEALASALGPISSKLLTTTSRTGKEAKEFLGKNTACEDFAGELQAKIADFTKEFPSAPTGPDARDNATMATVHRNFMAMAQQYYSYTDELRKDIKWGEACVSTCEKLTDIDYAASFTVQASTGLKIVIAIASLAKTTVQLATALA